MGIENVYTVRRKSNTDRKSEVGNVFVIYEFMIFSLTYISPSLFLFGIPLKGPEF
jgi:hypothetical protein